jgi:hypothetical protein
MEAAMAMASDADAKEFVGLLRGQKVWFINGGGAAGSTFSLSLGKKSLRAKALQNPSVSEEFRLFQGEFSLYVWSTWRLQSHDAVASSDQDFGHANPLLQTLAGQSVTDVIVEGRCLDLRLILGSLSLQVFCDHVPPEPSFDANWELTIEQKGSLVVGPGFARELTRI